MERSPVTGGLSLPEKLGVSPKEEKQVSHEWETLEGVVDTLNRWGFLEARTPKVEVPTITAALLLTPDIKQYTVLYANQLHWYNYANILRARVVAELLQLENEMEDIGARLRKSLRETERNLGRHGKGMSIQTIDDEVTTEPRYRELKIRAQELKQYRIELEARVDDLERGMRVISRQVEIRKEETISGDNSANMPHRSQQKQPPPPSFGR